MHSLKSTCSIDTDRGLRLPPQVLWLANNGTEGERKWFIPLMQVREDEARRVVVLGNGARTSGGRHVCSTAGVPIFRLTGGLAYAVAKGPASWWLPPLTGPQAATP